MDVRLYALSTCPYCRMTKKFLDESGVEYELTEVDLLDGDTTDATTPKFGIATALVDQVALAIDRHEARGARRGELDHALLVLAFVTGAVDFSAGIRVS